MRNIFKISRIIMFSSGILKVYNQRKHTVLQIGILWVQIFSQCLFQMNFEGLIFANELSISWDM